MGWSDGIFTRVHDWTDDESGGYDILSTRMDEEDDNFEEGINACLHKGGQNLPTDNLPMGGFVHTGVGDGKTRDCYANIKQVQDGEFKYASASNNLNNYAILLTPSPGSYLAGQQFNFKPINTNSGATTLNVNGLGQRNVYSNGAPCTGGEIVGGRIYSVIYDGTQFHLVSGSGSGGGASYGGAKICISSEQTVVANTPTTVSFRTELYDDSSYYSAGSDALVIPVTGRYRITAFIRWTTPAGDLGESMAMAAMAVNASRWYSAAPISVVASSFTGNPYYICPDVNLAWEGQLTQNDLVTIKVTQSNAIGSERPIYGNGTESASSWLAIERIK